MKLTISTILMLSMTVCLTYAQEGDVASEIKRVRKELMRLQTERKKNKLDMKKDKKNFDAYEKRTAERMANLENETDSIRQQIRYHKGRNDSLAALINYANSQIKQVEMSQEAMRKKIIATCDMVSKTLGTLPPLVKQKSVASTALLKNELRNKSVENVEAVNRLQQIMKRAEEANGSIQVSQESSPISQVRGTVYRLRLGSFFETAVNMKGEEAAVWYATNPTEWKSIENKSIAEQIFKAANIREGKSMPAFVKLPLVAKAEEGGNK